MSFFEFRNQKIFYEEYGEGKPLLLLHGNTASGKMFIPLIPSLAREYKVAVMDFLGCSGGALAGINLALEHPTMISALIADSFEGIAADPDLTDQIRIGRDAAKKDADFYTML